MTLLPDSKRGSDACFSFSICARAGLDPVSMQLFSTEQRTNSDGVGLLCSGYMSPVACTLCLVASLSLGYSFSSDGLLLRVHPLPAGSFRELDFRPSLANAASLRLFCARPESLLGVGASSCDAI